MSVFVGPRQAGKSSFLSRLGGRERKVITFDDLATRERAAENPRFFLDGLGARVTLDEVQYVPALFPEIKRRVDEMKARRLEGSDAALSYWLTGSNRLLLDRDVSESLTGRATYYRFHSLSAHEIATALGEPTLAMLLERGGWPELWTESSLDPVTYLNDHLQTTLEKDLIRTAGIEKVNEFLRTVRLLAGRVGGLFVASEIGRDAGVRSGTVAEWVSFLERMLYVVEVPAFTSSRNSRLIKASKYYFLDLAVATRLQGWTEMEPILNSPAIGGLFENLVVSEIIKTRDTHGKSWELSHFRTREKEEVDLVVSDGIHHVGIECKRSSKQAARAVVPPSFKTLGVKNFFAVSFDRGRAVKRELELVSIFDLPQRLLAALN
ncbi:MAG: ATP-binding protein [Myxococcaceae bacterium]